jgi:hypothetical protein
MLAVLAALAALLVAEPYYRAHDASDRRTATA